MRALWTACTSLWLTGPLLATSSAGAADPPPSVTWSAPATCPQTPGFVAELERFLGQALSARHDPKLAIAGVLKADERAGYTLQLSVVSARGSLQRELSHRDCVELTEASALVAALALEPDLVIPEPVQSAQAPLPHPEATPPPPPTVAVEPVPVPSRRSSERVEAASPSHPGRALQVSISALGLLGNGVLPGTGVGVGGQIAGSYRRFRIAARSSYWLPRAQALGGSAGAWLELGAWGASVRGCGLPISGDVSLALCAGPEVGDLFATGIGQLTNTRTAHQRWSALAAEVSLGISAPSGLATQLGVELAKVLESPRFGVREDGVPTEIFRSPGWTLNGFVALGLMR